jgi:NADH dehydrogenase FAD-containing subunit
MTAQTESNALPRVVVVGGGFGEVECAFYLRMPLGVRARISLVSDRSASPSSPTPSTSQEPRATKRFQRL